MGVELGVQSEEDKDNVDVENVVMNNGTNSTVIETGDDESEDEDVDFNPFMKGSPSEEASSSLSSEVEVLDVEVVNSRKEERVLISEVISDHVAGCTSDKFEDGKKEVSGEHDQENGTSQGLEIGSISGNHVEEDGSRVPLDLIDSKTKPTVDFEDEDAICKRTRARYSLASFTLDELETFLQETDDDDDFQNVDEEEEYRKFLAAVLKGSDGDDQGHVGGNDEEDDDEDNDADFEIEIQEALSLRVTLMIALSLLVMMRSLRGQAGVVRPGKKRLTKTPIPTKMGMQGEERPLRPLIPVMLSAPDASVPCLGENLVTNPSHTQNLPLTGFVSHQIGQLYCLIYEHVQLLIQAYSLCVLEPSRQHIASQVKGLLSELLHKRDLVLNWRNVSYSSACFVPQHADCVSVRGQKCFSDTGVVSESDGQGRRWLPPIGSPVLSVLDVEPLKLTGKFIDDVSKAVREHQKRCVETTNYQSEKQPLFPHPVSLSSEVICDVNRRDDPTLDASAVASNDKGPKKTLAGTLVESAKKQSLALVPQQIAQLAEPFYPLFNPALFPHKPPLPAVANRVLFTDAEDVLLATGMMEYNNDWKSIQQRFLPCKSEHQIFVRAKNRCSSKAPDNPIKAVRMFKTSPLTEDEKARIEEGLKTFRLDWTLVWRNIVPYRDPNLLPRQWRVAIGTQKSYKVSADKKVKHRIYESVRRSRKAGAMGNSHSVSQEDNQTGFCGDRDRNGEDGMDNDDEAFVHEAFLADWRPNTSGLNAPKIYTLNRSSTYLPGNIASSRFNELSETQHNHGNKDTQCERDHVRVNQKSFQPYTGSRYPSNASTSKSFGCDMHSQAEKPGNLVKLAPELPPVKLPPAVRVISQASFRSSQLVSSAGNPVSNPAVADCIAYLAKPVHDKIRVLNSKTSEERVALNNILTEDRGATSDTQMHPLLFRSLDDGNPASYQVNNSSVIPTFSFFPALQRQMGGDSLRNQLPDSAVGLRPSSSKGTSSTCLNFHPLLQRTSEFNAKSPGAGSTDSRLLTDLELSRDQPVEELIYRAGTDATQLASASRPTSPSNDTNDANDVDLGIHLSASRKRKVSIHEGNGIDRTAPSVSEGKFGDDACKTYPNGKPVQHESRILSDAAGGDDLGKADSDKSAAQLDKLRSSSCSSTNVIVCDQALLEIVMEQEELSDSDEEMEDVEFECEEMTDSDGEEGSAAEPVLNSKQKGINAPCSKSGTGDAHDSSRDQRDKRTAKGDSVRLGTVGRKGSWLSLNSHGSHQMEQSRAITVKYESKKYSKKATISRKEQKCKSPRLVPLPSSSRKHRKQVTKTSSTSRDVAGGNISCKETDGKV